MPYVIYNTALEKIFKGDFDIDTLDIRAALIMDDATNDPATEIDAATLSAFWSGSGVATVRMDGAGYPAGDIDLTGLADTRDDANDLVKLSCDNATISSLSAGTYDVMGILVYAFVTNDADSWPIAWLPYSSNQVPDGNDFPVNFHANGFFRLRQAAAAADVRFFNTFCEKLINADIDLETSDIRCLLTMDDATNDCMTETDVNFLDQFFSAAGITTVEFDGTGHVRTALANKAVTLDLSSDLAKMTADNVVMSALSAGLYNVNGVLLYVHVTTDADSYPILYRKYAPQQVPNGSDFTIEWGSNGVMRLAEV